MELLDLVAVALAHAVDHAHCFRMQTAGVQREDADRRLARQDRVREQHVFRREAARQLHPRMTCGDRVDERVQPLDFRGKLGGDGLRGDGAHACTFGAAAAAAARRRNSGTGLSKAPWYWTEN